MSKLNIILTTGDIAFFGVHIHGGTEILLGRTNKISEGVQILEVQKFCYDVQILEYNICEGYKFWSINLLGWTEFC